MTISDSTMSSKTSYSMLLFPFYQINIRRIYMRKQKFYYATYKLMNIKNHNIYNDKFTIGVVDLNRIDLATDEDKEYSLDDWVRLFKAKTWEELKMIAENKPEFLEASETLYEYNADLQVRQRCIARQEYLWDMKRLEKLEGLEEKTALLESRAAELENKNEQLENENERLRKILEENGIIL